MKHAISKLGLMLLVVSCLLFLSIPAHAAPLTDVSAEVDTSDLDCTYTTACKQTVHITGPDPNDTGVVNTALVRTINVPNCTPAVDYTSLAFASAKVEYGKIRIWADVYGTVSPQYLTCYVYGGQFNNSYQPKARATVWGVWRDKFTPVFPGLPWGTPVEVKYTAVLHADSNANPEGLWNNEYDIADAFYMMAVLAPGSSNPTHIYSYDPNRTAKFSTTLFTGISYNMSMDLQAIVEAHAGWQTTQYSPYAGVWFPYAEADVDARSTASFFIDVLTPGASYTTETGTIYPTSDSTHLDIALAGTGSGTVKSSPAGIDCGLACSAYFLPGTTIALTAIPTPDGSIFSSWGGDPACTGGNVFMTETKSCTATFDLCPGTTRAQIGSTNNYDSITLAYGGAATSGDTIKVIASNQQEGPINFNSGKSVVLEGGYDCSFNNIFSFTMVTGSIAISTGDVTFKNIVIL